MTRLLVIVALLVACGTGPTPVPGPTPADPFAGAIVDCAAPEPAGEAPQAESAVRACLVGEAVAPCLVAASSSYRVDTIACVVRELGDGENRRVLSGNLGPDSTTIDNAARAWIQAERLGYR